MLDMSSMNIHKLSGEAGNGSSWKKIVKYSHCLMCDKILFLVELANRRPCDVMFCALSCFHKAEKIHDITRERSSQNILLWA